MKHDADKIVKLDDHKIAGIAGPQADAVMFSEYIGKNMALYAINNDMKLSTHATANYIRTELAGALRRVALLLRLHGLAAQGALRRARLLLELLPLDLRPRVEGGPHARGGARDHPQVQGRARRALPHRAAQIPRQDRRRRRRANHGVVMRSGWGLSRARRRRPASS